MCFRYPWLGIPVPHTAKPLCCSLPSSALLQQVHGESLLRAIQACYHIYLVSRNQVNRNNAKTVLAKMMNVIFQRMENAEQRRGEQVANATSEFALPTGAPAAEVGASAPESAADEREESEKEAMDMEAEAKAERGSDSGTPSSSRGGAGGGGAPASPSAAASAGASKGSPGLNEDDEAALQVALEAAWDGIRGVTIYPAVIDALQFAVVSSAFGREKGQSFGGGAEEVPDDSPQSKTGATTQDSVESSPVANGGGSSVGGEVEDDEAGSHPSAAHRDAYLVFRALCKLAMRGSSDDEEQSGGSTDPIAVMSKTLSLELLRHILDKSGPSLRTPRFIGLIKKVCTRSCSSSTLGPHCYLFICPAASSSSCC